MYAPPLGGTPRHSFLQGKTAVAATYTLPPTLDPDAIHTMLRVNKVLLSIALILCTYFPEPRRRVHQNVHELQQQQEDRIQYLLSLTPRELWRQRRGVATPVVVGSACLWFTCELGYEGKELEELWLLPHLLRRVLGVPSTTLVHSSTLEPDVLFFGGWSSDSTLGIARSTHSTTATVFVATEPDLGLDWGALMDPFHDQYIDLANVSLGMRLGYEGTFPSTRRYTLFPLWMHSAVDPGVVGSRGGGGDVGSGDSRDDGPLCPLHPALLLPHAPKSTASAWRGRPHYALLLTTHAAYPRLEIALALNATPHKGGEGVNFNGAVFGLPNALVWPPDLNNTREGKLALAHRYRFLITPENTGPSPAFPPSARGYASEKLVHAHLTGSIPVYWGYGVDSYPAVFNPARILQWGAAASSSRSTSSTSSTSRRNHTLKGGVEEDPALVAQVAALEAEGEVGEAARDAWFAQPPLLPSAQGWVEGQCKRAAQAMGEAVKGVLVAQILREEGIPLSLLEAGVVGGQRGGGGDGRGSGSGVRKESRGVNISYYLHSIINFPP